MRHSFLFRKFTRFLKYLLLDHGGARRIWSLLLIIVFPSSQAVFYQIGAPTPAILWSLPTTLQIETPTTGRYILGDLRQEPPFGDRLTRLLWLEYDLELSVKGPRGELRLWDDCDGWSATHLRLRMVQDRAGRPVITWDTLDLFSGIRVGYITERRLQITVRNVTPDLWGRKPCTLTLVYEREGAFSLRSLHVLRGGVAALPISPPTYRVTVGLPQGPFTVGEPFRLSVLAWNRSSVSSPLVRVSLLIEDQHLQTIGPSEVVRSGRLVRHSFWIRPLAPGTYRVGVQAVSPGGGEALWFGIQITPKSEGG